VPCNKRIGCVKEVLFLSRYKAQNTGMLKRELSNYN
jgi:hypothetical protein